jgi:hypothetical protein
MSLFGGADIGALLAELVRSPRVQSGVSSIQRALPMVSGPFGGSSLPQVSKAGASPKFGTWYDNPGGNFGNTVGSIVAQLNSQGQQQQDPMAALYAQLLNQLQQPVQQPTGVDKADLMRQIQNAINPIYDAREQVAQGQSDRAVKDVQGMYGALSQDYQKLAPEQVKQAADMQAQIEQMYGQLRQNIEGSYARVSKEQGDLFKSLGIESALPTVLDKQAPAVTDALTAASENQTQQQQRYADIGQMDSTYYREGAPNAILRGNEVSGDILSQLQDYIQQTEGDRTSGIQSAYMDQLGQANSLLAQQQQSANSEAGRRQEMLWSMLQSQLQGNKQSGSLTPDSFMSTLPPQTQQSVASAFTQLQRSPEAVYGKVQDPRNPVPGTFVDTSPEWYMAQADQMLQNGTIDPTTHQALLMYMQLYFGLGSK